MKAKLSILILFLSMISVIIGGIGLPAVAAAAASVTSVSPICMYYYGGFNATVKQRLISTRPEFVVLNTPGGSYKNTGLSSPTPSDIADLKAVGIKVISYISTGNLVQFKYNSSSPPNDRAFVRGCIQTVAAEGCSGIFFDEGGVGNHPSHADRYLKAPTSDMYGNANSWAGYTIEDYASYAHSLGLIAIEGTDYRDPQYLNPNVFSIFDYVLTDEQYTTRTAEGSELGHESQCWVIGSGLSNSTTAAQYTNTALNRGFGAAYHCPSYGTLGNWYESYISNLTQVSTTITPTTPTPTTSTTTTPTTTPTGTTTTTTKQYQLEVSVQGQGTTSYGTGDFSIPANQVVNITATPASGWVFRSWNWPGNDPNYAGWRENPTSWTMVEPISIIAIFDQISGTPTTPTTTTPTTTPSGTSTTTTTKQYQLEVSIQGQGTTSYGTGVFSIPANQVVNITATPASGWVFRSWNWPGNDPNYAGWRENPTSWTMVEPISIIAVFDRVSTGIPTVTSISVVTNEATNLRRSAALLNGTLTGLSNGSATLSFEWGTDTRYTGGNLVASPSSWSGTIPKSFNYRLYGLKSKTTYHYRAKVVANNGNVIYGSDVQFTTS